MKEYLKADLWGLAEMVVLIISAFLLLALAGCASPVVVPISQDKKVSIANATVKPVQSAVIVPHVPSVVVAWSFPVEAGLWPYVQVWASTNLATWQLKTNIAGNSVEFPATLRGEFYKIRGAYSVGQMQLFTDWARH